MAKLYNSLWIYSGVRGTPDGRYSCYCPTWASKSTVLLDGANRLVSLIGGTAPTSDMFRNSPFYIKQNRIFYYPNAVGKRLRDLLNANYIIYQEAQTGRYYFYWVTSASLIADETTQKPVIEYGIRVDYIQTYVFPTWAYTTATGVADNPISPGALIPAGITAEVIPANIRNGLITRTSVGSIINRLGRCNIWKTPNKDTFKSYPLCNAVLDNGLPINGSDFQQIGFSLSNGYQETSPPSAPGFDASILLKISLGNTGRTIYGVVPVPRIHLFNYNPQTLYRMYSYMLEIAHSDGMLSDFVQSELDDVDFELEGFILSGAYKVLGAWFLPELLTPRAYKSVARLRPTNSKKLNLYFHPVILDIGAGLDKAKSPLGAFNVSTHTPLTRDLFKLDDIRTSIFAYCNGDKALCAAILPYLIVKVGNVSLPLCYPNAAIAAPDNPACSAPAFLWDIVPPEGEFPALIRAGISIDIQSGFHIYLTNGTDVVEVQDVFSLDTITVVDQRDINNEKSSYYTGLIAQGVGMLASTAGVAGSILTGNIAGGIASGASVVGSAVQFGNAISTPPNFEKMRQSNVANRGTGDLSFLLGVYIDLPLNPVKIPEGIRYDIGLKTNGQLVFSDGGAEIKGLIATMNFAELMDRETYIESDYKSYKTLTPQPTGYIELGADFNIPEAEAKEVVEEIHRKGVCYYYE